MLEKKIEVILLKLVKKLLVEGKAGELEAMVSLAASDIVYLLRKEAHGINDS